MPEITEEERAKWLQLPTQEEAKYTTLSPYSDQACANCRFFAAEHYMMDGTTRTNYCHLIENWPESILPTGYCERHERKPEPEPEVPVETTEEVVEEDAEKASFSIQLPQDSMPVGGTTVTSVTVHFTDSPNVKEAPRWERVLAFIPDALQKAKGWLVTADEALIPGLKIVGNRWLITWSNNFEDREEEIFTAKAIDAYVERVDSGIVALPEVWVWHADAKTRIGKADWVARHGHFVLAAGEFDSDAKAQHARDYYRVHLKDTGVSHGFVYPKRAFDGKHYHEFNTFEISLLPRGAEANRYTSLEKVKEMALTPEKQKYLEEVFGAEQAKQILEDLDKRGKALEDIGAAYKDFSHAESGTPNHEAVKEVSGELKEFVADLLHDSAEVAAYAAEAMQAQKAHEQAVEKAFADYKTATDAKLAAQDEELKAMRELLDARPRSASKETDTEIDDAKLGEEFKKQFVQTHPFFGTEVTDIGD